MSEFERHDVGLVSIYNIENYQPVTLYSELALVLDVDDGIEFTRDLAVLDKTISDLVKEGYTCTFDGEGYIGMNYAHVSSISELKVVSGFDHRNEFNKTMRVILSKGNGRFIFYPELAYTMKVGFNKIDYKHILKTYANNYAELHMKCRQCQNPIGSLNNCKIYKDFVLTSVRSEFHVDCDKYPANYPTCKDCGKHINSGEHLISVNEEGKIIFLHEECEGKRHIIK